MSRKKINSYRHVINESAINPLLMCIEVRAPGRVIITSVDVVVYNFVDDIQTKYTTTTTVDYS